MSSLVAEILSSAGKLEKEELGSKIGILSGHIEDFKIQVQESLLKRYVDFMPVTICSNSLENRATMFTTEIQSITNVIQNELVGQIQESADEFKEISAQLRVAETALDVVNKLIAAHDALRECGSNFKNRNFLEAVRSLEAMKEINACLAASWTGQIKLLDGLQDEYLLQSETLKYDMEEIWKEYLVWSVKSGPDGEAKKDQTVQLTVSKSGERLESLVKAMRSMVYLDTVLKRFVKRLQEHVIHPIIAQHTEVSVSTGNESSVLCVIQKPAGNTKPTPGTVFDRLTVAFTFLDESIGKMVVSDDENGRVSLTQHLGAMIYPDFCQLLVEECLSNAIPSQRKDLKSYNKVVEATIKFCDELSRMGFAHQDDDSILKYARNVDTLFANKMCQDLLCQARQVMMKDLYDSIPAPPVGVQFVKADNTLIAERTVVKSEQKSVSLSDTTVPIKHWETDDLPDSNRLSSNLMRFPECHISNSAKELVDMLYNIMEEASSSSQQCAARLFTTARNIVHLYCDIMPCYHKDSLESLPQQSALFHNNCMYLAHHLMTLGHRFRFELPAPLDENVITFLDLVMKVRQLGVEVFLAQMRTQRKRMINILTEVGDFRNIIGETKFVSVVERALKQCLLQLEHLRKVWQSVLPQNACQKSLGTLLNTLIEEIITRVTTLEDLPADNATHLIGVLGVVKERAPGFFKSKDLGDAAVDLQRYVPKWMKFQELLLILAASMQDILDRWASGKGPLAQEFTVDEAKQLIRALFQNTDRRAAVLAKIK